MRIVVTGEIIRVTSGGQDKDFPRENEKEATDYLMMMVKKWSYASLRFMCTFERVEE